MRISANERSHGSKLAMVVVFTIVWSDIILVCAKPVEYDLTKLYVNVPGNKRIGLKADPDIDTAATLKVKLLKSLKEQKLRPYNRKDWNMDDYVLTYYDQTIMRENLKLSKFGVPKAGTLYLVLDF